MPIYAYRCTECGHAEDILQKISAAPLTACPACGQSTYAKQVTAAGFQLKGSGWYVTDFRDNAKSSGAPAADAKTDSTKTATTADKPAQTASAATESKSSESVTKPASTD